jgi:hypothetical protein
MILWTVVPSPTVTIRLHAPPAGGGVGGGDFGAPVAYAIPDYWPVDLAVSDINGDDDPDLVIGTIDNVGVGSISVFLNDGAGAFAPPVTTALAIAISHLTAADVDGDDDADVVASVAVASFAVLRNDSAGGGVTLTAPMEFGRPSGGGGRIVAADLDGDADLDVAVASYGLAQLRVFLNTSAGAAISFAEGAVRSVGGVLRMAAANIDLDDDIDLMICENSGVRVAIFRNQGDGSLTYPVDLFVGPAHPLFPYDLVAADLNGDARTDLAVSPLGNELVSIYLNDAEPTSLDRNDNGVPDECDLPMIPGDLDGDGDVDVGDLLGLLAAWGPCPGCPPATCPADLNGDCQVNVTDLLLMLANWG